MCIMINLVSVMNSIVKTPAVRNFATATMLTLGVLGVGACAGGNSNKTAEKAQTEIVSIEGAEALKSNALASKTESKEVNKKVEQGLFKVAKVCVNEEVANESVENFINVTNKKGTFIATSSAQNYINLKLFRRAVERGLLQLGISKYDIIFDFDNQAEMEGFYKVTPEIRKYFDFVYWVSNDFDVKLENTLNSSKQSYEEVSATLDKFVNDQNYLTRKEKKSYFNAVQEYKDNQLLEYKNTIQGYMDIVAFKTKKIAEVVYQNKIKEIAKGDDFVSDEAWQKYNDLCKSAKTY